MELNFNVTGAKRKELVSEIARIDGSKKEYLGVPSCAYRVGDFHISKDGVVSADEEKLMDILETLMVAGFEPAGQTKEEAQQTLEAQGLYMSHRRLTARQKRKCRAMSQQKNQCPCRTGEKPLQSKFPSQALTKTLLPTLIIS